MLYGNCMITWLNEEITMKRARMHCFFPQVSPRPLSCGVWFVAGASQRPRSPYHLPTLTPHFIDFFSELLDVFLAVGSTWTPSGKTEEKPRGRRNLMSVGQSWVRIPPRCALCALRQVKEALELSAKSGWSEYPCLTHRKRPRGGSFAVIAIIIIKW